jgi:hypothetical protein
MIVCASSASDSNTTKVIEVTAFDANGVESRPVTENVEVQQMQTWVANEVSKTINKVLNILFSAMSKGR